MIKSIRKVAKLCGITTVVTNGDKSLETQLNALTKEEELPILLISWDVTTNLTFDENNMLRNPSSSITCLLMTKPYDLTTENMELSCEEMGKLFINFINKLNSELVQFQRSNEPAITGANFQNVPKYGMGRHSGIIGRWSMKTQLDVC